jgi:hypothetical protein
LLDGSSAAITKTTIPALKFLGHDMSGYSLSWAQAGAIVSTPEDLTKWARALYQGTKLLPKKAARRTVELDLYENGQAVGFADCG